MTIRYEINPPKVTDPLSRIELLNERIEQISTFCDGIHVTDSVLGIERISPLIIGAEIKQKYPKLNVTISLRVIDKTIPQITDFVDAAIHANLDGVLVLMGDPSTDNYYKSGVVPSFAVNSLIKNGFGKNISLYLSLPSKPNFEKISKKVNSTPNGFVTQVVHDASQVKRLHDYLSPKSFKIIPCLLFPSPKNSRSAEFLKLDWSNYEDDFSSFVLKIENITGDLLLTSPNDFKGALDFLTRLQN
ncbi:MAG: methylenetetrahydrofolate reductase [Crenarchaeota archaeon]|nr:methylenetetrahydrofolate reductase [Thermoproteota archaeon]MDA1125105.1 methylenetetrahydrofolate reductase [Thermoproteota archaeon]